MDYNPENKYSNIFIPLEAKFDDDKIYQNNNDTKNNQIYNFNYNGINNDLNINNNNNLNFDTNNIFGLNFHQDEEDNDENQIINSLHFSKFNINNQNNNIKENINNNYINNYNQVNNFEQKIKNNRNMLSNNINLNIKNSSFDEEEEPYQISASKYAESNFDNHSIFNNSKMNNNFNNNKIIPKRENKIINDNINNNKINKKNISSNKKGKNKNIIKNNQAYNTEIPKTHQNYIKHNLILNNNYYINNNNPNITNNKDNVPIIVHTKSFSSKRNKISDKNINNPNSENYSLNNYYKIPNIGLQQNKETKKKNTFTFSNSKQNQKINNKNINHKQINSNLTARIHNNLNSKKPIKNNTNFGNVNESFIPKEENFKKIYSKTQKAELDMVRGCYIFDKKYSNFDIKNRPGIVNYIKFIKPTEPILQINYKNVDKFYPLIRKKFINELNDINKNNNIFKNNYVDQKNNTPLNNDNSDIIDTIKNNIFSQNYNKNNNKPNTLIKHNKNNLPRKIPKNNKKKNLTFDFDNHNFDTNLNKNTFTLNNIQTKDKDGISLSLKKKIYDWLVDINIIKDKIIKVDSLPTLCINGVLLCDLINRCEGKNEIIKGIIRRTNTRSQIQVNINKVLEYLRTLEKFPSRNLWNNIEISKGNNLIIWQLLDDIYNFYGNKINFKKRSKKGFSNNNTSISSDTNNNNFLNRTFTRTKEIITNRLENFENNTINNQFNTNININTNQNNTCNNFKKKNKNIYLDNKYNSKNNYFKYAYTSDDYNTNIQKKKKILDENLFEKNTEFYNNNIIYDISKKLDKKEKQNSNINPYKLTSESSNRNNLNHTNDNIYESKMFSMDTSLDGKSNNKSNTKNNKKIINNNLFQKNLEISSISSDKNFNFNAQKNNKSFSVNNGVSNKKRNNQYFSICGKNMGFSRYGDNQSFYSTNPEGNRKNRGCFLLFEKSSINKLKEKIGTFNKYNANDLDTLDIKDI